jgi:hypothetical protein
MRRSTSTKSAPDHVSHVRMPTASRSTIARNNVNQAAARTSSACPVRSHLEFGTQNVLGVGDVLLATVEPGDEQPVEAAAHAVPHHDGRLVLRRPGRVVDRVVALYPLRHGRRRQHGTQLVGVLDQFDGPVETVGQRAPAPMVGEQRSVRRAVVVASLSAPGDWRELGERYADAAGVADACSTTSA